MAYTTVTDECPFIRFSGNTLEDVVVEKSKVKLELVGTTINVVFISGGAQIISWNEAQALEYGYTPTSLYSYILGILKVQCGGGGGGIDSVQAGTNVIIDNSDPANPIINATFSQEGKYLISGGAAWSGTGLTYDVTALTYFFNGNKISLATQVTLAVADPTNNRLDAIVVDEAGVVSVIQGTASVNPITPPIPEEQLLVQYILVEAGLASPSVSNENIYLDDPAGSWTLSTYTTGAPTGTLVFNGTTSPKEGINHIQANADQRLGARFVRATSFDAFQYTVLQVWVRFTGTSVDSNRSLKVRFENSGGSLVGNTVNLFNFGLQRNIINTWQLVVIPLTSFGSLPATVKGIRMIMTGGTVGVPRQWDIDYMHLTNGSIPYANVPTIAFQKDGVGVGSASTLNIKEGANMTITPSVNPISGAVEYEFEATSSGGGGMVTLTKAQLDTAISGGTLVAGTLYKITGVDTALYGGTDIFLKAVSSNQIEKAGHGLFYNPKYNQAVAGYGIWTLDMEGNAFSSIVGNFDYANQETVTADNGATGTLLADGFIRWISGDWSGATAITGGTSGATANVSGFTSPNYNVSDTVIWGGKHWTNTSGNNGSSTDDFTLSGADWTVVPFDSVNYNVTIDIIEYDYSNDVITYRKEVRGDNEVGFDVEGIKIFCAFISELGMPLGTYLNPIKHFQFGNYLSTTTFKGVHGCNINNSVVNTINYRGDFFIKFNALNDNLFYNNIVGSGVNINSSQSKFLLMTNNVLIGSNTEIGNITSQNYTKIQGNILSGGAKLDKVTLSNSGFISNNILSGGAAIENTSITDDSRISYFNFNGGGIKKCSLSNWALLDGTASGILSSKTIQKTTFDVANVTQNLSGATIIFGNYYKEVYQRPDGTARLRYYDDFDTLQIVNVND